MRTIFAEYNPKRNSIDVYTAVGYMLRIDCLEAEKNLKTTPGSDCALNALAIDEPLEYAKLYLDGNLQLRISILPCIDIKYLFPQHQPFLLLLAGICQDRKQALQKNISCFSLSSIAPKYTSPASI